MKLFDKRPLSLILCIMLVGLFVFADLGTTAKIVFALLSLALLGISFIPAVKSVISATFVRICLCAFIFSTLFGMLFFDYLYSPYNIYGEDIVAKGYITDKRIYHDNFTAVEVTTTKINEHSGASYKFNTNIYGNKGKSLVIGSEIVFKGKLSPFSQNDEFRAYNYANGIFANLDDFEIVSVITLESPSAVLDYFKPIRQNITNYAIEICGKNAGALLSALIIGERSYLDDKIELDFSRVGITHILALSGMHLVILTAILEKLLLLFKIKKTPRNIIKIFLIILYMALTGFPSSVVRAGIMVIIALLLFIFQNKADPTTSLFVSVWLIVIFNPYSVFDLSLLLSFLATLGVIVGSGVYKELKINSKSKLMPVLGSIFTSLFSVAATLIVVTVKFGGISLISPISTLLFSFVIEIFMFIGIIALILGGLIPVGVLVGKLGNLIISAVSTISQIDFIYASTANFFVKILVVAFSVAFVLFITFEVKKKKRYLISLGSALMFIFVFTAILCQISVFTDDIVYYFENEDEQILITGGGECSVIDFSDYTSADYRSLIKKLTESNITDIEQYIIPLYSARISLGVERLISKIKTDTVYLPTPINEDESALYNSVLSICEYYGVSVALYETVEIIKCGNVSVFQLERTVDSTTAQTYAFAYLYEDKFYTHFSNGAISDKNQDTADELIEHSDICIFGSRGKKYEIDYVIKTEMLQIKKIIISSENILFLNSVKPFYENKTVYFPDKISLIR